MIYMRQPRDMNKVIKIKAESGCQQALIKRSSDMKGARGSKEDSSYGDRQWIKKMRRVHKIQRVRQSRLGIVNALKVMSNGAVCKLVGSCNILDGVTRQDIAIKELHVVRTPYFDDRLEVFNISSLSLKRLSLSFYHQITDYKVVINAPKLEYIYIHDYLTNHCSLTKPLSLVEADILHSFGVISQLLPFLSSTEILKFSPRSTRVLDHVHRLNMPIFPYLVRLVIGWGFDFLPVWLNNMPNLEHITFFYWCRPVIVDLNLPVEPPVCLRFKMKEIIVEDEISVTQEVFTYISTNFYSGTNFCVFTYISSSVISDLVSSDHMQEL
ncbi:hypothetical protein Tco_0799062 [Tanacetum coccineum]